MKWLNGPQMKILLPDHRCFVIRSMLLGRGPTFFESHKAWNKCPAFATIFQTFEAAEHELWRAREIGLVAPAEILDVVRLGGAVRAYAAGKSA
jgi:hypothetical protein